MKTVVTWLIVIAIIYFAWTKALPWWKEHHAPAASATASIGQDCVSAAAATGDTWGSGVGRFANPPYDTAAWNDFRSRVDRQARQAEMKCLCAESSCKTAKGAMNDLRALVSEMDASLRGGLPPPSDLVQRQEAIDNAINSARELAQQGK
jgi:hypothetical protein